MRARAATYAVIVAITLGGAAFAQNKADQTPKPTTGQPQTTGQAPRENQAPVGHRQPRPTDLPPEVGQTEMAPTPQDKELDERLKICRNC
jgi:hypothetical protein